MIHIKQLVYTSRKRDLFSRANKIINNISLHIPAHEIFAVIGPNGAGKSTLIKAILNFIHPVSGTITLNNSPTFGFLPENPYYYCRAGQALAMDGIIPEAIKYLEKGIADDVARGRKIAERDFYQFKFWLGYCYANNRQLYFAERQLRQVLKKYPGHIQAQSLLKQILAVKKR